MCIHVCGEAIVWVGQPKLHTVGFLVLTVAAAATACTVLKIVLETLCVCITVTHQLAAVGMFHM